MSIPGLSLPGLSLPTTEHKPSVSLTDPLQGAPPTRQHHTLQPESEFRFETHPTRPTSITLLSGSAELFGTDLAPNVSYTFHATKAAVFTWSGCTLEVLSGQDDDHVATDSPMWQYANVHFALEDLRSTADRSGRLGTRVLILGGSASGKTTLAKILSAYAIKAERKPIVVGLDPREGLFSVPGSLTATVIGSLLDVEEGWGSSPISGPSAVPVKTPLCYHFGCEEIFENERLYKAQISRLANAVSNKFNEDREIRASGCIIDTPASLGNGNEDSLEIIQHIISAYNVTTILSLSHPSDTLLQSSIQQLASPTLSIINLIQSPGSTHRESTFTKSLRYSQIKQYFHGRGSNHLAPSVTTIDYSHLNLYRITTSTPNKPPSSNGEDDDDEYDPAAVTLSTDETHERIQPSLALQNALLAVTHVEGHASLEQIRDASVMFYIYVADVDDVKRRVKVLSPLGGRVPLNAVVWGTWPEGVVGLVG